MIKKRRLAVFLSLVSGVFSAFASGGAGVQAGVNAGEPVFGFVSVTFRTDTSPWVFSMDAAAGDSYFALYADNWFVNKNIAYPLSGYVFWGISAGLQLHDDFHVSTGARLGAGLDLFVFEKRNLELYAQAAWNPCLGIEDDGNPGFMLRPLCFPVSAGARLWFY